VSIAGRALAYASIALEGLGLTRGRPLRGPLYAQVGISDACDHRCVMCPYHPPGEAEPGWMAGGRAEMMSVPTFERLLDELVALGTQRVDLVGRGEPMLHPAFVDMVRSAKRRGLAVSVTTNASRLTLERAHAMIEAGLDTLRISLNAGRRETYGKIHVTESPASYDATRERVAALMHARNAAAARTPHVTLSFTISRANFDELRDMVEAVATVGADAANFQHVIPSAPGTASLALASSEHARLIHELVPAAVARARELGVDTNLASFAATPPPGSEADVPVPCHVGSYFTVVLGNGAILPCCQTKSAVGHLEEGFGSVWRGDRYVAFRRAARGLPARSPELATCQCDRCYFRPHNLSIERMVHPLRAAEADGRGLIAVEQLLRMSRLDGVHRDGGRNR
jgi:MoaA/NifB/PqqE/SkfB family radical SAM enzyme